VLSLGWLAASFGATKSEKGYSREGEVGRANKSVMGSKGKVEKEDMVHVNVAKTVVVKQEGLLRRGEVGI
jgi:hypothetical protein